MPINESGEKLIVASLVLNVQDALRDSIQGRSRASGRKRLCALEIPLLRDNFTSFGLIALCIMNRLLSLIEYSGWQVVNASLIRSFRTYGSKPHLKNLFIHFCKFRKYPKRKVSSIICAQICSLSAVISFIKYGCVTKFSMHLYSLADFQINLLSDSS
jgi:hypothetical protein